MDTGVYSGDNKDIDHLNVVATWQALQYQPRLLDNFQALIWDEVHGAKAHVAQKLLNEHGAHIPFKFGVTGTFPKPPADQMSLRASIGDTLIEIPARWLIDNGYLAEVDIEQVCLKQSSKEQFPDYAAEKNYLSKNEERIEVIAGLIIQYAEQIGNTLVLVNSVPFGENLTQAISGNAVFLYGASKKKERKAQYDLFETQDDMIVVATSGIASTGISIDRVKCLIFVDAGKSYIKAIQSVGRGTRLASDKKMVKVIDIFADLKWSKAHARERVKWYKESQYPITNSIKIKIS
jgi:superfamily II DNA or RNA helicase